MIREIKFRAWDELARKMAVIGFHVIGEVTMFNMIDMYIQETRDSKTESTLARLGDFILEQFTGFQDVNDVDLYEGDRVKVIGKKVIGEIIWSDLYAGFALRFQNKYNTQRVQHWKKSFRWLMNHGCEIIGNIHENPELLEK